MMDSLYAKYLLERQGIESVFDADSFATYQVSGRECFIVDFCVASESRQQGRARKLVQKVLAIAKGNGCTCLTGNIHLKTKGSDTVLRSALALGFAVAKAQNDILLISMEIGEERNG